MAALWSDPHRLPGSPVGYERTVTTAAARLSEVELAFLSGVVTGVSSTAGCSRRWSMRGSLECVGMGDERDPNETERRTRADVYASARIGAAAVLTIVLVVLLVLDVAVPDTTSALGSSCPSWARSSRSWDWRPRPCGGS